MARRAEKSETPSPYDDLYDATPEPTNLRDRAATSITLSPSGASDKENSSGPKIGKGKGRAVLLSRTSSGLSESGKRKRKENHDAGDAPSSRRLRTFEVQEDEDNEVDEVSDEDNEVDVLSDEGYDPDQNMHKRRALRNKLRGLTKDLNDNRAEYLNANSKGIIRTLEQANSIACSVKQTADATIDSRLLVTTADLSYRKTVQLTLGDSAQGVDVDEFVSKCISMMRRAGVGTIDASQAPSSTQTRRRRTQDVRNGSGEEDGDEGDMLNWEALGYVALQHNARPALAGFLLGPLSLEKRARKVTQRKAGLKVSSLQETQPQVLRASDIHKSENTNLSVLCTRIRSQLDKLQVENQNKVQEEVESLEDPTEKEIRDIMYKHGVLGTGGLDFFQFVINPFSFGQTVENMFYVSFLIRDGKVGINFDDYGVPSLEPSGRAGAAAAGVAKHQAILGLDMSSWKELIEVFNITEPMIPHREEDEVRPVGARGWYT